LNILKRDELLQIIGGVSISGTLINSFVRGINAILEVGRSLGSAIRRIVDKNICPL
jgi:hypothetical protein